MTTVTGPELEAERLHGATPAPASTKRALAMRIVNSSVLILLILLLIAATFAALNFSAFATARNVRNIIDNVSILLVVAVGSTFVIATAGIDLSVGSVLVFSGVVAAEVLVKVDQSAIYVVPLGIAICVLAGAAWGTLHGFLITKGELSPLIVTLATLGIALGLAQVITGGIDVQGIPAQVTNIAYSKILGVPVMGVIAGGVALAGGILLHLMRFGMVTLAIGSNPEAARRAGINVDRHLIKVYALAGSLSGLAGFLGLSQFATTTIGGHATDVLQVITGVVIGGTSLFGGVATMFGTVVGMLIPGVLQNGLLIVNVAPFWQQVAVGIVLLLAVYLDRVRRRA
jgi:ribose transport system permease protein